MSPPHACSSKLGQKDPERGAPKITRPGQICQAILAGWIHIERLHEEFKRRIKTQTVLQSAETAAMLFWALLASGQITMREVNGWQTLGEALAASVPVDLAA